MASFKKPRSRFPFAISLSKSAKAGKVVLARKPKRAPRRARQSLSKGQTKQVKKIISTRKESKYCPNWYAYDDYIAYAGYIQPRILASNVLTGIFDNANGACTCVGLQTGKYLNSASQAINAVYPGMMLPLGGFGMQRGDDSTSIDGDYAYLQSSHIKLQIACKVEEDGSEATNDVATPLDFRLIQVRVKKDAAGTTPNPLNELFVDLTNVKEGLSMSGSVKEIMRDFPINSNRFTKVKDIRFTLCQPVKPTTQTTISASSALLSNVSCAPLPSYPNQKELTLWLNKPKKKLRFATLDDGTTNYFEPLNYDFVDYVFVIASRKTFYNSYMTGTQPGSMPSQNTSRCWTIAATGQTKYKDC